MPDAHCFILAIKTTAPSARDIPRAWPENGCHQTAPINCDPHGHRDRHTLGEDAMNQHTSILKDTFPLA